jgi:hypothetical protein
VAATWAVVLLAGASALAYDNPQEYLEIPFIDVEPRLDDFADMQPADHLRGKLAKVTGFVQREPDNGTRPSFPTEVYVAYDSDRLYAVFVAFDDEPDRIRANMSPRENVFDDDSVNIMIDTFNDQRTAYFFLSTPLGIQADGRFIEGRGFDTSFQAVWDSEGRLTDRGFLVRIAVPFASIRFPRTEEQTWRVIFNRMIPRLSEDNFWPQYSREIEGRLNQTAILTGIRDISPGRNIQLVPFGFYRDLRLETEGEDAGESEEDREETVGLDAKMVLGDAMVLDVTANPDFSQVESDEPQVTVNRRFEVFFPERRPFFLENADLFRTPTNLFFSRRIVDPGAGVRLTGKQGRYALGVLLANDEAPGKEAPPGDPLEGEDAAVGVVRVTRDVSTQSRIGLLLSDRELGDGHNRVGGLDGRIKLNDNWVGQFQLANAATRTTEGDSLDGVSWNLILDRDGVHLSSHTHYLYTSPGFRTELGFLGGQQRPDSQDLHHQTAYRFRPAASPLVSWGPTVFVQRVLDTGGGDLDSVVEAEMEWNWTGNTGVALGYRCHDETLPADEFDTLSRPTEYAQDQWFAAFGTQRFSTVGFSAVVNWGTRINLVPPEGEPPELADFVESRADLLWRPIPPLRLDLAWLRSELGNRGGAGPIFTNTLGRARLNWQFTRELSLRLIADFEDVDPVPDETSLADDETLRLDALVRYLWNPWWALYIGYTSQNREFQELDEPDGALADLREEGRQFFVKFSYLFQL